MWRGTRRRNGSGGLTIFTATAYLPALLSDNGTKIVLREETAESLGADKQRNGKEIRTKRKLRKSLMSLGLRVRDDER